MQSVTGCHLRSCNNEKCQKAAEKIELSTHFSILIIKWQDYWDILFSDLYGLSSNARKSKIGVKLGKILLQTILFQCSYRSACIHLHFQEVGVALRHWWVPAVISGAGDKRWLRVRLMVSDRAQGSHRPARSHMQAIYFAFLNKEPLFEQLNLSFPLLWQKRLLS